MTPAELLEARRLVDAASPGPWLRSVQRQAVEVGQRGARDGVIYGAAFWVVDPEEDDPGEEFDRSAAFIAASRTLVVQLLDEVERLRSTLTKVSEIRDSIVGMQGFNFSEHAYPLVAALDGAGFKGAGHEIARANLGTLIEQVERLTKERDLAKIDADEVASYAMDQFLEYKARRNEQHEAYAKLHALLPTEAERASLVRMMALASNRIPADTLGPAADYLDRLLGAK